MDHRRQWWHSRLILTSIYSHDCDDFTFETWGNTRLVSQLLNLIEIWWAAFWTCYKITLTHFLLPSLWNRYDFPRVDVFFWPDLCFHGYGCNGERTAEWKTLFCSVLVGTARTHTRTHRDTRCMCVSWQWSLATHRNLMPKVRLCSALEKQRNPLRSVESCAFSFQLRVLQPPLCRILVCICQQATVLPVKLYSRSFVTKYKNCAQFFDQNTLSWAMNKTDRAVQ